jgi:GntR family transcriptional repressor for pyruvate dehydrogenase complex
MVKGSDDLSTSGGGQSSGRPTPTYQRIADDLRAQIESQHLNPGDRLPSETDLATRYDVGRGTAREAIRVLVSRHLVETVRGVHGGTFVSTPDPSRLITDIGGTLMQLASSPALQVAHLVEARILLEPPATRLAATRASRHNVSRVMAAAKAPREPGDPSGFKPHINFHAEVLAATGNPMLPVMLEPLSAVLQQRLQRSMAADNARWEAIDQCHVEIAAAIARGDGDRGETLMREHLLDLRELYQLIDRSPPRRG